MIAYDFEVIARAQAGDEEAFSALVKLYTPYAYRTAYAYVHRREEAEDVVQEIFIKLFRSLPQLREVQAFPAWFKQLISRTCLDRLKKGDVILLADTEIAGQSTPNVAEEADHRLLVREAIRKLNREQREVLLLREWQGYDYQEIAGLLGIPVGTVKSRLHTAREQLKKILSASGEYKGMGQRGKEL